LCFKMDWASFIVARKFSIFALFYFVFEGNFQVQAPQGAYIWWGDLTEGFLLYEFGGLIFGGAYFRNFTVLQDQSYWKLYFQNQKVHQVENVQEMFNFQEALNPR